jgi:putative ABC transport system substrate-binding protein
MPTGGFFVKKIAVCARICLLICIAALAAALGACDKTKNGEAKAALKIGIAKIVQHPALDTIEQGIQDGLSARNIDAVYDLQNANGDISTAAQIAAKFKAEKVDIEIGRAHV